MGMTLDTWGVDVCTDYVRELLPVLLRASTVLPPETDSVATHSFVVGQTRFHLSLQCVTEGVCHWELGAEIPLSIFEQMALFDKLSHIYSVKRIDTDKLRCTCWEDAGDTSLWFSSGADF